MKILFVVYTLGYTDNIAIAYLSAIAKQLNHETFFHTLDDGSLINRVKKIKPHVIGYSANILGFDKLIKENQKAKKVHNFVSIMGGPHPTFSPHTFLDSGIDAYCIGEGEYAFKDFLEKIENNKSYHQIDNLITKNGINSVRPLIKNLDELPVPDRDLIISNSFLKNISKKTFYTSRGCPFRCSYCCNDKYNKMYCGQRIVRRFSVDRTMKEIKDIIGKYRIDFIRFGDDLFASKINDWLIEFVNKYKKQIGIPFNCLLRCDLINDELIKLLKDAGCYSISLSVDSTSYYIREKVLRRNMMKKADLIYNIKKIKSYGINTFVNYMLAIPESTIENDLDTIEWTRRAKITYANYTTATPMPGTSFYDYCAKNNLIDNDIGAKNFVNAFDEKSILNCFTKKEKNIRYNIYLLGNLVAKLPKPFYKIGIYVIKHFPSNLLFKKIRSLLHVYFIKNKIYRLAK